VRYVYLPVVSARNVSSAPSYNFFKAFRHHALQADPNAVFYVLIPEEDSDDNRWLSGSAWAGPNTVLLPTQMHYFQYDDLALITNDFWHRFNERHGDTYFDVIISERPILAPTIRKLCTFHLDGKSRRPLLINRDQFVITKAEKVHFSVELAEVFGWVTAPTMYQSPHQLERALEVARRTVKPNYVQELIEQAKVFPLGIDCDDVDEQNMTERDDKYDEITINYSHKLFSEQKFIQSLDIMDSTFAGGRPVQLQIVTGSSEVKMQTFKEALPYQYIKTFGRMNRSQFLRQMARAHIFISNSVYEDFSATVVEQMYTGLIPILLRAPWSEYLVPEGYPYLFSSMAEGQGMMRYVVDNYDEVYAEWMPKIQEKIRAEFDLKTVVPEIVEWIQGLHDERISTLPGFTAGTQVLLEQVYQDLPDEFDLEDFYDTVKKFAKSLDLRKQHLESRATSPWLFVDLLRRLHPELSDTGAVPVRFKKG
jgi:hypothetical protein